MAEGFLRAYGGESYVARSAGTKPSTVNPLAVRVMREIGIDISNHQSKNVGGYLGQHFPFVITVCDNAKEHCPIFPGPCIREHWPFPDPAAATGTDDERLTVFRNVRDAIGLRVRGFVSANAPTGTRR